MKETLTFIIQPHSTVDIITNSSTEVFVCQRGHSLKTVKEIFESIAGLYHRDADIFDYHVVEEGDVYYDDYDPGTITVSVEFYSFPWDAIQLLRNIFEFVKVDQEGEW